MFKCNMDSNNYNSTQWMRRTPCHCQKLNLYWCVRKKKETFDFKHFTMTISNEHFSAMMRGSDAKECIGNGNLEQNYYSATTHTQDTRNYIIIYNVYLYIYSTTMVLFIIRYVFTKQTICYFDWIHIKYSRTSPQKPMQTERESEWQLCLLFTCKKRNMLGCGSNSKRRRIYPQVTS